MATIITRETGTTAVNRALTNTELDNNFINLNTDIGTRILSSEKAAVNGVATLDATGKVPATQLPSYVDDVQEAANLAAFPATGETGKIYVALDTNKAYRWSGSVYVYITSGAVDSVAGRTGVVVLTKSDVGLANADNTADSSKNVLSATKWTTARTISITGDLSGSVSVDGTANASITGTLPATGVSAGSYGSATAIPVFTVDAKGRITAASTSAITVGNGALSLSISTGSTNTAVSVGTGTGFTANSSSAASYTMTVGPALVNLATLMTTAGAGFIRRGATADTYTIDTNTYLTAEADTLATVTARGASTSTSVTLSGTGNQFGGHFYFLPYDAAGNHYPHFNDGGSASGSKINWRLYTGVNNTVTHTWTTSLATFATNIAASNFSGSSSGTNTGDNPGVTAVAGVTPIISSGGTTPSISHATSGATAGTYNNVTVNTFGHVTGGSNAAYLTDAMRDRGGTTTATVDTATLSGFYNQQNTGDSHSLLVFNPGGSTAIVQQRFHYGGSMEFRNKTDSATWTAWKTVVTSSNIGTYAITALSDTLATVTARGATTSTAVVLSGGLSTGTASTSVTRAMLNADGNFLSYYSTETTARIQLGRDVGGGGAAGLALGGSTYALIAASDTSGTALYFKLSAAAATAATSPNMSLTSTGLSVAGTLSVVNGDSSYATFGPNTTYAGSLRIGTGVGPLGLISGRATIYSDNGNLKVDAGTGQTLYLNQHNGGGTIYVGGTTNILMHSGNYNSYAPTLTGGGASGTWGISITGSASSAATVTNATFIRQFTMRDDRSDGGNYSLANRPTGLYAISGAGTNGPGTSYLSLIHVANASDVAFQIAGGYNSDNMYFRGTTALQNGTGYSAWRTVLHSGNYTNYAATVSHNHQYNVNNDWLRDNNDDANVKLYGNSRQMAFRTDGTTEYATGVGGYPFAWMYGGDGAAQRLMLLNTTGDMWTSTNGWLSTALAGKQNTGSYLTAEADTLATVTGRGASTSTNVSLNGGISSYMGDSGVLFQSYNTSASNAAQFNISHSLGAVTISNARGTLTLNGNVSGSSGSTTGNAATATTASSVTGLTLTSSANGINPDNVTQNQIGYNTSVSLFGQTDGGLYSSAYSSSWIHQIYGDFRTGQIAIRGKNSGTWQAWRTVVDSSNVSSYAVSSISATSPIVASASTGAITLSHANSGVTAGTYNNVTVNNKGHVTAGSNAAYLTAEADTLATVTGRGATTTTPITLQRIFWNTDGGNSNNTFAANHYSIGQAAGAWTHPYPDLIIGHHTGIRIGAHYNYGGTRFYNNSPWGGDTGGGETELMSIGNGDDHVRIAQIGYAGNSFRAPIFYDSNDTSYYVDPASTSDTAQRMRGGTVYGPNVTWGAYLLVGGDGRQNYTNTAYASVCTTNGNLHLDSGTAAATHINWYDGTDLLVGAGDSGTLRFKVYGVDNYSYATGSMRSPIFYDSDDTAYYGDFAGTSRANLIKANSVYDWSTTRGIIPNGASYTTSAGAVTGAFKIKLPDGSRLLYPMLSFTVQLYNYSTGTSRTFRIGGHFSGASWHNIFAYCLTDYADSLNVRFGYDAANAMCVWIGETGTTWSYPQVFVTDFQNGYSAIQESWFTGWSITLVTAFDTVSNGPYTPAMGLNSKNYNSYAPTLTGTGASGTWGISISGNAATSTTSANTNAVNITSTGGTTFYLLGTHTNSAGARSVVYGVPYYNSATGRLNVPNGIVLDAGNYNNYSPSLTGNGASGTWGISISGTAANATNVPWTGITSRPADVMYYEGFTLDANTMSRNSTGFSYSVNAPWTGPIARFSAGGSYDLWLNAPYGGGGNQLSFRTRNGDTATYNAWKAVLHDGNYNSYSPTLTGTGASGTWGINITGNSGTTSQTTWTDLYVNSWFRNNSNNTGLYNQANGNHFYSRGGNRWGLTGNSASSNIYLDFYATHENTIRGSVHADTSNNIGFLNTSGNWSFMVSNSGNATATGTITANSDERLKKDWTNLPSNFVEKLSKVKSGTYTRIDTDVRQAGSSAQEWQILLPEVVITANNEDKTLSLAYGNAALVSAIELAKEVVNLNQRIAKLEALVAQLIEG